ncbi:hypothetical protein jhhlp_002645 [Lomentospora prolificans]|uniref:Uncharacterized protein n=1 Tax=Lomentospora prolificans TaxID=41688 RepID=A0A2N3NES1_9PEZI|nr:hypothetical protein jhhlp_002645 [Lomentospora prolificans]
METQSTSTIPTWSQSQSQTPSQLEAFLQPFHRPASYFRRAAVAASYPLRGIWYFLKHREFHPLLYGRLLPLTLISFLVYFLLFTFAFLPQFAFLAIWQGRSAWINAIVLVLGEGFVIIQALFEGFFVDEARVDIFDATLINHSLGYLVSPHRICHFEAPDSVKALGKPITPAVYTPWSLKQILELIFFLPLNFIPWVGTPAFILITGSRLGKLAHYRWYKLRGLNKKETKAEIRSRSWQYLWFGTVAMILEFIPVFSLFFLLTTTAGAALYAARFEEELQNREAIPQHHPGTSAAPSQASGPDEYHD